jgi:hypothetical protein
MAVFLFICSFEQKKMRRCMAIVAGLAMVMSCGLREIGEPQKIEGVWQGPGAELKPGGSGAVKKSVWYVTGFDYPEGYDWMSDPEAGSVKCSLVVYANAVPMLKVPVGTEYQTSADPDMHRMIDGDLYTDFSTDSMTVIKKNGRYLFSYPGREMIAGMHVDSSGVYTLGQSRRGEGFTFRRDGELLFEQTRGSLMGRVAAIENGFAFSEKVSGSNVERYYLYRNGEVSQIAVREDVKKVWDVTVCNGDVCFIATLTGIMHPVLVCGDEMYMLDFPLSVKVASCSFVPSEGDMLIEGVFATANGILTSGLWRKGTRECLSPTGMTVWTSFVDGVAFSCLLSHCSTGELKISRCGEICSMPEGYTAMGTAPLAMADGILYVGMTSLEGGEPAVWMDGEIRQLGFNGYISSISVWTP